MSYFRNADVSVAAPSTSPFALQIYYCDTVLPLQFGSAPMKPQPGRPSCDSTLESIGVAIVLALVVSIAVAVTGGAYVMSAIEIEVGLDQQEAEAWGTILVIYFVVSYAVAEIWEWFESVFSTAGAGRSGQGAGSFSCEKAPMSTLALISMISKHSEIHGR